MSQPQQNSGNATLRRATSKGVVLLAFFILTCEEIRPLPLTGSRLAISMFFMELERTNPAMLKAMNEKWSAQEHRMVANGRRTRLLMSDSHNPISHQH